MAKRVVEYLVSDLSGEEIEPGTGQTVAFSFGSASYEIDLTDDEAEQFEGVMEGYINGARKTASLRRTGGRRRGKVVAVSNAAPEVTPVDNKAVRKWAASQGIEVSSRGRISADVVQQYRDSGN